MTRSRALAALLCALGCVAALAGCGNDLDSAGSKGYVSGNGVITVLPEDERRPPGEVAGETLEGDRLSLASYDGQVVVVNVWGAWCPPCRAEADDLATAARELARQDVAFVGINTRDSSRDNALSFQRTHDVPYPSLYDPSGRTLLAFRGTLRPNSIPSTVVIDEQGRVAASILGELTRARTLVDLVEDVRRGRTGSS
jgi:thiol-disulfide isomerase/thioredoxin